MKKRILLVEDDMGNAHVLTIMCQLAGYEVVGADNGLAALAVLAREPVDLVLMDVRMPYADGPKTLELMRAHPSLADIPVVFLTAGVFAQEHASLWALNPAAVLEKPIGRRDLIACLHTVLGALTRPA